MERHVTDDAEPDELEDFGFHHDVEDVFEVCNALLAFRVLPAAGGWFDQPAEWVDDIKTFFAVRNRKLWERDEERGENYTSRPNRNSRSGDEIIQDLLDGQTASDWQGLFKD